MMYEVGEVDVVVCCPVRKANPAIIEEVKAYIETLKVAGKKVFSYWDTMQQSCPSGADILFKHLEACKKCNEAHVFWSNDSVNLHFEIGTLVTCNKRIVIKRCYDPIPLGQSYLSALCVGYHDLIWDEPKIARPIMPTKN